MGYRSTLRADAVARLAAANTAAGARVYDSPPLSFQDEAEALPAIGVFIGQVDMERQGEGNPSFYATVDLVFVAVVATGVAAAQPPADDLCEAIEDALLKDSEWHAQFDRIDRLSIVPEQDAGGAVNFSAAHLTIRVGLQVEFKPEVEDDLTTLVIDIDMASPRNNPQTPTGPDGQIDAQEIITVGPEEE